MSGDPGAAGAAPASGVYVARVPVRFGDTDYARIVYYPRLLHLLHVAFEDLWAERIGIPYDRLIEERNLGFPVVHMECDFRAPIRFGEVLQVAIGVPDVGRSSVLFTHEARVRDDADLRATARLRRVCVDMGTLRPVPLPDDLRLAFAGLR